MNYFHKSRALCSKIDKESRGRVAAKSANIISSKYNIGGDKMNDIWWIQALTCISSTLKDIFSSFRQNFRQYIIESFEQDR